jgi:hypothetical protein
VAKLLVVLKSLAEHLGSPTLVAWAEEVVLALGVVVGRHPLYLSYSVLCCTSMAHLITFSRVITDKIRF